MKKAEIEKIALAIIISTIEIEIKDKIEEKTQEADQDLLREREEIAEIMIENMIKKEEDDYENSSFWIKCIHCIRKSTHFRSLKIIKLIN